VHDGTGVASQIRKASGIDRFDTRGGFDKEEKKHRCLSGLLFLFNNDMISFMRMLLRCCKRRRGGSKEKEEEKHPPKSLPIAT
jgi:hypothetical protein